MESFPLPRVGRLEGRTCLIVGGTSGIGLAAARRFLEEGARVVVTGRINDGNRSELAQLSSCGRCWELSIEIELGETEITRLFDFTISTLSGRLDILVHSAGVSGRKFGDGALHECSDEGWEHVMRI